jgi:gamma-glutamylcyclotransferase (GGCT)/AIG2-like uncharacterized protein YtfP
VPLLFSYGTLQRDDVQLATFGRRLPGQQDQLPGFERSRVAIEDAAVVPGGETHYQNAVPSSRNDSRVAGTVFEVTDDELAAADEYERPAAYARTPVTLASGKRAWVYVHAPARQDQTAD